MEPTSKWTSKRIALLAMVAAVSIYVAGNMYVGLVERPDSRPMYLLVLGLGAAYVALSVLPTTRAYLRKHAKRNFAAGLLVGGLMMGERLFGEASREWAKALGRLLK